MFSQNLYGDEEWSMMEEKKSEEEEGVKKIQ